MSVVVAIKDNDKIWVGCDSQVTRGYSVKSTLSSSQRKIWRASDEDELVMGLVGSLRDLNILADGSGYELCLGTWNGLKDNKEMSIRDKLVQVIKSACDSDLYVNYPIIIMNTKDKEIEIIEK